MQLLTLSRLEPGELVQFRSATHVIDASADAEGRLVIPVLLQLHEALPAALLERASGQGLAGHVSVRTLDFEHMASLPRTSAVPRLAVTRDGRAVLATRDSSEDVLHIVSADATIIRMASSGSRSIGSDVMLNPQPLPPDPPPDIDALRRRWPGIVDVIVLPDASGAVAVALRRDGTRVLLNRQPDGEMRIAGRFSGPIGQLRTQGEWAMASGRAGVQVLRRLQ